jgi:hypothetical protein
VNWVSGRLKLTGQAAWMICVTVSCMRYIVLGSRLKLGWSVVLVRAWILEACSGVMRRLRLIRLFRMDSKGEVRRVRQYIVEMESSWSSS